MGGTLAGGMKAAKPHRGRLPSPASTALCAQFEPETELMGRRHGGGADLGSAGQAADAGGRADADEFEAVIGHIGRVPHGTSCVRLGSFSGRLPDWTRTYNRQYSR